jgi:RNA polymerase sigma-70 factor (ECF subfamily)
VAGTLRNWTRAGLRIPGIELRLTEINGGPGVLVLDRDARLVAVMALEIQGGQIQAIRSIVNPEKLAHLGPTADLGALLRGRGS